MTTTDSTVNLEFKGVDDRWNFVLEHLPAIGKDSSGEGLTYKFRSIDTVLDHLNPLLAAAGVHIIPTRQQFERGSYVTKHGTVMNTVTVTSTWQIRDVEGGFFYAETVGEGSDAGDKATSKAQTMAFKYLLWPALAINSNEDPDGVVVEPAAPVVQTSGLVSTPNQASAQVAQIKQQAGLGNNEEGITEKQGKALWAISGGGKKFSLAAVCSRQFGKAEKDLTKKEASALIDGLNNGSISTSTDTTGTEAVVAAFPGASEIGATPDGYSGEPF